MKYISTRNNSKEYSFEEVFIKGLADDGGLFIPSEIKKYSVEELRSLSGLNYQDLAKKIIYPFISDFMTADELSDVVEKSYSVFRKDNAVDLIKVGNIKLYFESSYNRFVACFHQNELFWFLAPHLESK